ncbi:uncharacterized protein B0H64DRAFT_470511 [Chaetomium fimeti]|uniref:Wax synthase domain-containing protein n=1 Tax=Chaetomium fimeti TaxID=1854472 RepID=A0AAE0HRD7_9PEZI|nr:hypothetical protein B0H64DRAFT_470511 [Chaetomium fimeti]
MAVHPLGSASGFGLNQESFNLAVYQRQQYRDAFNTALAAGEVKPLIIPWSFVGSFFLPLLYLSIPHTNRPWLYRMRWLVAATVVYLNVHLLQTTSAINEAVAFATGLLAVWGTIWALRLLIFTRPQWDAARVERRPRRTENGHGGKREDAVVMVPPDESVAASLPHNEYFWQPFPATAPYLTRLGWTADLLTACRGAGWNFSISTIPHPPFPTKPLDGNELVRIDLIPLASRAGTQRSQTYAAFLRSRLLNFTLSYLTIDLLTSIMRQDPYFVLGPDYASQGYPLPPLYARLPLPQLTIPLLRNIPALAGIMAGIHLYHSLLQLAIVFPLRSLFGARAELWQHPTLFGGFVPSVLDRGLAGFWGGWWHQTFRAGFVAPARWWFAARRRPEVGPEANKDNNHTNNHHSNSTNNKPPTALFAEPLLAFLLSGLLHAAGGHTAVPRITRPWTSLAFFALQTVGIALQTTLLPNLLPNPTPKRSKTLLRRLTNLLFTLLWLQLTAWGLIDDMGRAGVWLFEPVPASPLRALGLVGTGTGTGTVGGDEAWWRWDSVGELAISVESAKKAHRMSMR